MKSTNLEKHLFKKLLDRLLYGIPLKKIEKDANTQVLLVMSKFLILLN